MKHRVKFASFFIVIIAIFSCNYYVTAVTYCGRPVQLRPVVEKVAKSRSVYEYVLRLSPIIITPPVF
jgi:hypothetical protein